MVTIYKFQKILGRADFFDQFKKKISFVTNVLDIT